MKNMYYPYHIEDLGNLRYRVVNEKNEQVQGASNVSWSIATHIAETKNVGYEIPQAIKDILDTWEAEEHKKAYQWS